MYTKLLGNDCSTQVMVVQPTCSGRLLTGCISCCVCGTGCCAKSPLCQCHMAQYLFCKCHSPVLVLLAGGGAGAVLLCPWLICLCQCPVLSTSAVCCMSLCKQVLQRLQVWAVYALGASLVDRVKSQIPCYRTQLARVSYQWPFKTGEHNLCVLLRVVCLVCCRVHAVI